MMGSRLPPPYGSLLDREREIAFTFDGRPFRGFAGDTIASALIANGVRLLARSFKYHRPRGILTMSGDDANALVQLPGIPNVRADTTPVEPGMAVAAQHSRGSLAHDRMAWLDRCARFLPVGFYYRAFFRPRGAWHFWEPIVRRFAGLGHVDTAAPRGDFEKTYAFADVAVIGAGPAGMAAALAAAEAGADVMLVGRSPALGGTLTHARFDAAGTRAATVLATLDAAVAAQPRIVAATDAVCTGWFADNYLSVVRGNRLVRLRARDVVIATGALDQPAVFANNDLPGVVFASAAQRLIRLFGVRPGRRAVVLTAGEHGYGAALDLADAGTEIAAILDLREETPPSPLAAEAARRGLKVLNGMAVFAGRPNAAGDSLSAVTIGHVGQEAARNARREIACDLLCIAVGRTPAAALPAQAGARVAYALDRAAFAVADLPDRMHLAGAVNGVEGIDAAIADGSRAGHAAAGHADAGHADARRADAGRAEAAPAPGRPSDNHPWPIFVDGGEKAFVDFDEDLTVADIRNAVADGFADVELTKRFSTVGMGPSQGRQSALNAVRLVAQAAETPLAGARGWTMRPPAFPEMLGNLAGRSHFPLRRTALHDWHVDGGAQMMLAGAWARPSHYGASRDSAVAEEVRAVRHAVGLMDVSTLGSIEVRGPDASEFLERLYTGAFKRQPVGRLRYALMCDENGAVRDDGVACRFGAEHFYVTTTTGGSDSVYREMLFRNAQWRLAVDVANVTAGYAAVSLAGPAARAVLTSLTDIDLAPASFPYLAARTGHVAGVAARILRVGFVGELCYELHVPAGEAEALWLALLDAGRDHGVRPFGVEAQRVLRLEKGHVIVGQDTDALTQPYEAGLAWAVSWNKPYFTGARAIAIRNRAGLKRKLVGFTLTGSNAAVPAESSLVLDDDTILGHVTSAAWSAALECVVGLAYTSPQFAGPGEAIAIKGGDSRVLMGTIVAPPFYDPQNARQAA